MTRATLLVVTALMLSGCASTIETTPITLTPEQKTAVEEGIRSRLKDPASAQFGPLAATRSADLIHVCGTVNAKNSFGGYSGHTRYVASVAEVGGKLIVVDSALSSTRDQFGVNVLCRQRGL